MQSPRVGLVGGWSRRLVAVVVALSFILTVQGALPLIPGLQQLSPVRLPAMGSAEAAFGGDPIVRVSLTAASGEISGSSGVPSAHAISSDGRYVLFTTSAGGVVSGVGSGTQQLYVRDRTQGTTSLVSMSSSSVAGNAASAVLSAALSGDGRYVVFDSDATNLVSGDTNSATDVFLRDLQAGTTTRVSVTSQGAQVANPSRRPDISRDGSRIVFETLVTMLDGSTPSSSSGWNLWGYDRSGGTITSVLRGNQDDYAASISDDGHRVALISESTCSPVGDPNCFFSPWPRPYVAKWGLIEPDAWTVVFAFVGGEATSCSGIAISGDGNWAFVSCNDGLWRRSLVPGVLPAELLVDASGSRASANFSGRYVAYQQSGSVRLYDATAQVSAPVSVDQNDVSVSGAAPAITPDGTKIAFQSADADIVASDTNTAADVFVAPKPPLWAFDYPALGGDEMTLAELRGGVSPSLCDTSTPQVTEYPISLPFGEFWHRFDDFSFPGRGLPLVLGHSYSSSMADVDGPLGHGWSMSLPSMSLTVDGFNRVTIREEFGSEVTFDPDPGTPGAFEPTKSRCLSTLVNETDGAWTFTREGTGEVFRFDATGRLSELSSRVSDPAAATSLTYDGNSHLQTVTDAAGRTLTFTWTGSRVTQVTDSSSPARSVSFSYANGNLTDWTDVAGGTWHFTYDGSHRLLTMRDPRQEGVQDPPVITNHYDGQGRVDWQTDRLGKQTSFDYTSIANAVKTTDPEGRVTVHYFSDGVEVATTLGHGTPSAATWTYGYDDATAIRNRVIDPNGYSTVFEYDERGNQTYMRDALGRETSATYNALNLPLTTTDGEGVITTYEYDTNGNLESISTPLVGSNPAVSRTVVFAYDDVSHPSDVTSMTDPRGKIWTYGYDAAGNRNALTDPLGNTTTWVYNTQGWPTSTVSPRGNATGANPADFTTSYSYNAFGDVLTTTDPLGEVTTREYDDNRNLTSVENANLHTTTYVYDAEDRLIETHRPDSTVVENRYWSDGRLKTQIDGADAETGYTYDALGRLATLKDPLNNTTTYLYDGAGNLTAKQLPGGNCAAAPKTGCTTFTYDAGSQLKTVTYSDGSTPNVTATTYDDNGRRTQVNYGASSTSTWSYDSLGRITASSDGTAIGYEYNLAGQVTKIVYPGTKNVVRSYDDAGRFVSSMDWNNKTTTFDYDENANQVETAFPTGNQVNTYTYDHADRMDTVTMNAGAALLAALDYTRDDAGQLTGEDLTTLPGSDTTWGYDTLERLTQRNSSSTWTYDNADNLTRTGADITQTFNAGNQITTSAATGSSITLVGTASAGNTSSPSSLTLNLPAGTQANDQILVAATLQKNKSVNTPTGYTQVGNDFLSGSGSSSTKVVVYRRTAVAGDTSVTVTFGNNTAKTVTLAVYRGVNGNNPIDASSSQGAEGTTSVTVPSVTTTLPGAKLVILEGEVSNSGSWTPPSGMTTRVSQSDGGNIRAAIADQTITDAGATGTRAATFSTNAKLVGVLLALKPAQTTYGYDARGNRTSAAPPFGSATTLTYDQADRLTAVNAADATYAYNADGLRTSKTVSGTSTTFAWDKTATLPSTLTSTTSGNTTYYLYGPGGSPYAQIAPDGTTTTYLHRDQLGSTRLLTNAAGTQTGAVTYDAYGTPTATSGTLSAFGYAGQYTDTETGYQYLRARYLDPVTGQFLVRDPIASVTREPYGYASDSPLQGSDPSGLCTASPSTAIPMTFQSPRRDIRQFEAALRECERQIGYKLSRDQRRLLHDAVHDEDLDFRGIVEVCVAMFKKDDPKAFKGLVGWIFGDDVPVIPPEIKVVVRR